VAGDQAMMLKYVGSNAPLPGEHGVARYPLLDAVLDFVLYGMLPQVILGRANPRPLIDHFEFLCRYWRDTARAGRNYVTFFENHDRGAMQSASAGGATGRLLRIEKDPRLAVLASAFLLTSIGIPCLYYGIEQGFDGGGEDDRYVRECMFGGRWGAFDTTGMAFFNPKHPIYQQIAKLTKVRSEMPALRCGRQYFREISGDGEHFGYPHSGDGHCTLAYSRILDTSEVLVALNLDRDPRNDAITVDEKLSPPKSRMTDLLGGGGRGVRVQATPDGRSYVRLKLPGRGVAILANGR
jgi:glycosidase